MNEIMTFPLEEETKKDILRDLGVENIPQEKQEEILSGIGELLLKEIFLATIDRLSKEQQDEYEELLSKEVSPEEVENFLKNAIPDYEMVVATVTKDLMEDLKKDAGENISEEMKNLEE
ncbi:MAG: hypothetical protein IPN70_03480 [Candidatus Moraniibacteriota bacterium]|nr:MAG: hypothetical protein IPN70_03480 [Candidatus Moranbacteria bacterium]